MPTAETIFSDFLFSLSNITWLQVLDIVLVTLVFFVLLNLLRRSRASVLFRGTLVLLVIFFVVTIFLPLPTFDYILELALFATLIAIPIIFQPELRRLLEELGRRVGGLSLQQATAESALNPVSSAVEHLAERRRGALIVLEGNDDLSDLIQTGVPLGSRITSELLQTVFYNGTPLHDGAVIIRGDRLVAAGCVLPVSNRNLYDGRRRLGTRHRAALGLAETSDALVVVISEETGGISVAQDAELHLGLGKTELREQLHNFYQRDVEQEEGPALQQLWQQFRDWVVSRIHLPRRGDRLATLLILALSVFLALITWAYIIQETNPIRQVQIDDIALEITNAPPNITLQSEPPERVSAIVKAPNATIDSLGSSSFQAHLSLSGQAPGLRRVPVQVESSVSPVQIVNVSPSSVDIQLAEVITRSVEVQIEEGSLDLPSPALALAGTPAFTPTEVIVSGAAPFVSSIDHAEVPLPAIESSGAIQRLREVTLVAMDGLVVDNLQVEPENVLVGVNIVQRQDAREVGVQVVTEGNVPENYRLVALRVEPARVTVLGNETLLAGVGPAVETLPVDLTQAIEDISIQIALNLPPGIDTLGPGGDAVRSALVTVDVEERTGNRLLTRSVEVQGSPGLEVTLEPRNVEILVRGPLPTLQEIDAQPRLLRVVIEATELTDLQAGQSILVTPRVLMPEGLRAQLTPSQIRVTAQDESP